MKRQWVLCIVCVALLVVSCDFQPAASLSVNAPVPPVVVEEEVRQGAWTFIVYMAADNNLETAAIADFNELESVAFSDDVTVLVLFDRAQGNDATNDDWTDTRLFKVAHDNDNTLALVSERLDCPELGLTADAMTELDMAQTTVLSSLLAYAARAFPADHYGLIMWGHGTGWRGNDDVGLPELTRAFALDDASATYMTIAELRAGIENGLHALSVPVLDCIGFDTCFGICLETAYELRSSAQFLMGTPALVPANGWDYARLFSQFLAGEKTPLAFAQCALEQYQAQYATYEYAAFSVVDCAQVESVAVSFNAFAREMADGVADTEIRKAVTTLLQETCVRYCADTFPTDCYVDVYSFAHHLGAAYASVADKAQKVVDAVQDAVPIRWEKKGRNDACGMGVFYIAYQSQGIPSYSHDSLYINNSRRSGQ